MRTIDRNYQSLSLLGIVLATLLLSPFFVSAAEKTYLYQGSALNTVASSATADGRYNLFPNSDGFLHVEVNQDFTNVPPSSLFTVSKTGENGASCVRMDYCAVGGPAIDWQCPESSAQVVTRSGMDKALRVRFPGSAIQDNGSTYVVTGTKSGWFGQVTRDGYCSQRDDVFFGRNLLAYQTLESSNFATYANPRPSTYEVHGEFDVVVSYVMPKWVDPLLIPYNNYPENDWGIDKTSQLSSVLGVITWVNQGGQQKVVGADIAISRQRINNSVLYFSQIRVFDPIDGNSELRTTQSGPIELIGKLRLVRYQEGSEWRLRAYRCPNQSCGDARGSHTDIVANGWIPMAQNNGYPRPAGFPVGRDYIKAPTVADGGSVYILSVFDKSWGDPKRAVYLPENFDVYYDNIKIRSNNGSGWKNTGSWTKTITPASPEYWMRVSVDGLLANSSFESMRVTVSDPNDATRNCSFDYAQTGGFADRMFDLTTCRAGAAFGESSAIRVRVEMTTTAQDSFTDRAILKKVVVASNQNYCDAARTCGQVPSCSASGLVGSVCVANVCVSATGVDVNADTLLEGEDSDGDGFVNGVWGEDAVYDSCDCNDADAEVYPGKEEITDNKDNNCDGIDDNVDVTVTTAATEVATGRVKVITDTAIKAEGDQQKQNAFSALSGDAFEVNEVLRPGLCRATPSTLALDDITSLFGKSFGEDPNDSSGSVSEVRFYKGLDTSPQAHYDIAGNDYADVAQAALDRLYPTCPTDGWTTLEICARPPSSSPYAVTIGNTVITADYVRVRGASGVLSNPLLLALDHGPIVVGYYPKTPACLNAAIALAFDSRLDGSGYAGAIDPENATTYPLIVKDCGTQEPENNDCAGTTILARDVQLTQGGRTITFFPEADLLEPGHWYVVGTKKEFIAKEGGAPLLEDFAWQFQAREAGDSGEGYLCDIDRIDIIPSQAVFTENDETKLFATFAVGTDGPVNNPPMAWSLSRTDADALYVLSPQGTTENTITTITAKTLNTEGRDDLTVSAALSCTLTEQCEDNNGCACSLQEEETCSVAVGEVSCVKEVEATAILDTILCENPWGWEDTLRNPRGDSSITFNVATHICRDGATLLPTVRGEIVFEDPAIPTQQQPAFLEGFGFPFRVLSGKKIVVDTVLGSDYENSSSGMSTFGTGALMTLNNDIWQAKVSVEDSDDYALVIDVADATCTAVSDCLATPSTWDSYWRANQYGKLAVLINDEIAELDVPVPIVGQTNQAIVNVGRLEPGTHTIKIEWTGKKDGADGLAETNLLLRQVALYQATVEDDVIFLGLFENPDYLSPEEWQATHIPDAQSARPFGRIDGYPAADDGASTYIAHTNIVANTNTVENSDDDTIKVYPNILLITGGKTKEGEEMRQQMIANMTMNYNAIFPVPGTADDTLLNKTDWGYPARLASKTKLQSDMLQTLDFQTLEIALQRSHNITGKYPLVGKLDGAGAYVPGTTTSAWRSWTGVFATELGATPPTHPINAFTDGCTDTVNVRDLYDTQTCWNARDQVYACAGQPNVYQYDRLSDDAVVISTNMALPTHLEHAIDWSGLTIIVYNDASSARACSPSNTDSSGTYNYSRQVIPQQSSTP